VEWRNHPRITHCVRALTGGEIIAYPTEAVWGLGCDPANEESLLGILALKNRVVDKGLILIAADISQFSFILEPLRENQRQTLEASWPGHTTWLVPHHGRVSPTLSGRHATIALRVSDHPQVRALCEAFGPIVSTSANPQGKPAARDALKARCYFKSAVVYAPTAPATASEPSLIKDLLTGKTIRSSK